MPKYLSALNTGVQLEDRVTRNAARDLWNASYRYYSYIAGHGRNEGTIEWLGQERTDALNEARRELTEERIDLILASSERTAKKNNAFV